MSIERTCPQCGTNLSSGALEGLCPTCVGRAAFANVSAINQTSDASELALSPETEAELARLKPEEAGERIGPYRLMEQIGQGGFGTVWVADQEKPVRRRVALKIIKLGMDTKEVIARFEQERQALALMEHPHIAKVLDAGATQWGRPFFVMELVRGIKITDYCDQANLPTAERLALFIQVCNAVQHAHQKGIIHRDLKPSNILVTLHDGVPVPKVIDFGVAKATQQQRLTDLTIYTQLQQMIGTPLYMSPEQAEMSGLDIDTRSDIYSLGVLLYELLTGRTPFDPEELMRKGHDEIRRTIREQEPQTPSMFLKTMAAERCATVAQHRQSDPAALSKIVRGDLDWIVMKALEKDRTRRYETANGLAMDIQRHLASEPVLARPVSQFYRFRRLVKRNRIAFAAGGAVAVAVLLALVSLVFSNVRIRSEKNQKDAALQQRGAALADAKDRLFDALLNRARAGRFSGQMGQRLDSLVALAEAAHIHPDDRLRDEAIAAMALPDLRLGPGWTLDFTSTADENFQLSATWDRQGVITVRTVPDRREVRRIETGQSPLSGRLSGDGGFVGLIDRQHALQVWRVADGRAVLSEPIEDCGGFAFGKGRAEFVAGQGDLIRHIDLATGGEIKRWTAVGKVRSFSFNPAHRQLAVGYTDADVASVYDLADGKLLSSLPLGSAGDWVVAWHPDGLRLAAAGTDPHIQIWNVPAKRRLAMLGGHVQQVTDLSFHPGGELLASEGYDAVFRLWCPASGRQLLQLPHHVSAFGFSADGRWLGTMIEGDTKHLVEVAPCPEYRTIVSSRGTDVDTYWDGGISPDGSMLAMGMDDGARVWELASGRELAFLPPGRVQSAFFSADGRELITCGDPGLQRWPILDREGGAQPLRLGSAQTIALPFTPSRAVSDRDGKMLAVVSESAGGAIVVDAATGAAASAVLPHPRACYVALSPDGELLATAGWHFSFVRLWKVRTGEMIHEYEAFNLIAISFAPDSRTLMVTYADEFSFWDAQKFQPIRGLPRGNALYRSQVAFSPDGKLLALEASSGVIHITEAATGRTIARLTDPSGGRATWMSFTPDGTQLVTASFYAKEMHIWNLRRIRTRLKAMRLDWEWPEFPPANER